MAFDAQLTPLNETAVVRAPERERLESFGIKSVEELVDAIDSDPEAMAKLIEVSLEVLEEIRGKARAALSEEAQQALDRTEHKRYSLGAFPPRKDHPRAT